MVRRALLATGSSVALTVAGLAIAPTPAEASSCLYRHDRATPTAHQHRSWVTQGSCVVGARHFWVDEWGNQGDWTAWEYDSDEVLSPYKERYSFGEGSRSA